MSERVVLTGGIATGKSYCLARLADHGAATIDADQLAREAVRPGSAGLAAVRDRFGSQLLTPDDQLDRVALGRLVFRDPASRKDLEAIIHPIVYEALESFFSRATADPAIPVAIADIPLVFETGRTADFDRVIVAACSAEVQLQRLMSRDQISEADARQRIASQMPIAEKRARADLVIDTSGSFDDTDREIERVWLALTRG